MNNAQFIGFCMVAFFFVGAFMGYQELMKLILMGVVLLVIVFFITNATLEKRLVEREAQRENKKNERHQRYDNKLDQIASRVNNEAEELGLYSNI